MSFWLIPLPSTQMHGPGRHTPRRIVWLIMKQPTEFICPAEEDQPSLALPVPANEDAHSARHPGTWQSAPQGCPGGDDGSLGLVDSSEGQPCSAAKVHFFTRLHNVCFHVANHQQQKVLKDIVVSKKKVCFLFRAPGATGSLQMAQYTFRRLGTSQMV